MIKTLFAPKAKYIDTALLVLRIGIGFAFIMHGYPKVMGGVEKWSYLGTAMGNIGITFFPVFWGFMAAFTEFIGGIFLVIGLFARISSGGLSFTMFIAFLMHQQMGDPFTRSSHAFELFFVFMFILLAGAGKYSLDYLIGMKSYPRTSRSYTVN
jgi:putative oxidoreductase